MDRLPSLPPSPIQDEFKVGIVPKFTLQSLPQVWLIPCHDKQAADSVPLHWLAQCRGETGGVTCARELLRKTGQRNRPIGPHEVRRGMEFREEHPKSE